MDNLSAEGIQLRANQVTDESAESTRRILNLATEAQDAGLFLGLMRLALYRSQKNIPRLMSLLLIIKHALPISLSHCIMVSSV